MTPQTSNLSEKETRLVFPNLIIQSKLNLAGITIDDIEAIAFMTNHWSTGTDFKESRCQLSAIYQSVCQRHAFVVQHQTETQKGPQKEPDIRVQFVFLSTTCLTLPPLF